MAAHEDAEAVALEQAVNAEMDKRAYRFGPISIRRNDFRHPQPKKGWMAVDASGRRTSLSDEVDAERAVNALHERHKHRITLDHEIRNARTVVAETFGNLATGRIEAAYRDSLDAQKDSFMCIEVTVNLLTPSLRRERHRMDYRPYTVHGTDLVETRQLQRKRAKRLGDNDRIDALACCPVLAARIATGGDAEFWTNVLVGALTDANHRTAPHFVDGVLLHALELTHGAWWGGGALKISQQLPETILTMLTGRLLSDVIDHPWLPKDAVIRKIKRKAKRKRTEIHSTLEPVPIMTVLDDLTRRTGHRFARD